MFGNPDWFVVKKSLWGLAPVCLKGWGYHAGWTGVLGSVFLILLGMGRFPESLIWMVCGGGAYLLDVRSIAKSIRAKQERDELFYIGEENEVVVETEEYQLTGKGNRQEA